MHRWKRFTGMKLRHRTRYIHKKWAIRAPSAIITLVVLSIGIYNLLNSANQEYTNAVLTYKVPLIPSGNKELLHMYLVHCNDFA